MTTTVLCQTCGMAKQNMQRCGKCGTVYYCNIKCQKENWNLHKRVCRILSNKQDQDTLPLQFVNPQKDRFVSVHGNNTSPVTKCSPALKVFVTEHLKCDGNQLLLSSKNDHFPIGSYGQCYRNVSFMIEIYGGSAIYGWQFFENEYMIEAEAHALWVLPGFPKTTKDKSDDENCYINVTPCNPGSSRIAPNFFIPDENVKTKVLANSDIPIVIPNVIFWK